MSLVTTAPRCESDAVIGDEVKYDNFYTPGNRDFYNSFNYTALPTKERRIRILRIHPLHASADDNATIECDVLDDVSLEEHSEKFSTISYCAGDPKQTENVLVNGSGFNAFADLGHALRQARYFWKKTLWLSRTASLGGSDLHQSEQQPGTI